MLTWRVLASCRRPCWRMTELSPPGISQVSQYITNLWYALNIVKEVLSRGSTEVTAAPRRAVTTLRCSFSPKHHRITHLAVIPGVCWSWGGIKRELVRCFQEQLLHTPRAVRWGDWGGWFSNISLVFYHAKCDVRLRRRRIAAGYVQPLLIFSARWMSRVFGNDPRCLSGRSLPSANAGADLARFPKTLGAPRPRRRSISTRAVLVQLLKAIPVAGTRPWWHPPHQFARSGSFPWSRCNHDRRQQSREAQRDWSSEFLNSADTVTRCPSAFSGVRGDMFVFTAASLLKWSVSPRRHRFFLWFFSANEHSKPAAKARERFSGWMMDGWMCFHYQTSNHTAKPGTITPQQLLLSSVGWWGGVGG